ncbi:unnamed protein product [Phaedon cochleariae]|uniref:Uncharacterized protein n=1 Tax=Phaedon cochleariae TaxID=80249 RepID=A0A9P0DRX8_PHACE|nr:unnamed protein product [Phaedon cochleariae]
MSKIKTEADALVDLIKILWPQFQITRDNILHPTSDLAVRFYTEFITHCQERLHLLVGSSLRIMESSTDLDIEERVFQMMSKMSNLFEKAEMTFLLGDIYEPTVVRNKTFFRICIHIVQYYDHIHDEVERLGHDIFKMKEDGSRLKEQLEHLLVNINETVTRKSDLFMTVQKLSNDLKSAKEAHDDNIETNLQKRSILVDKRKQIEMLKCELQKVEYDLVVLERQEQELKEQTITEEEHKNLLQMLDNLENEIKMLGSDDVHMTDFLMQDNDVLRHYEMCNKWVPDVSDFIIGNIEQVIELEDKLYDLQLTTETMLNTKCSPTRQFVLQRKKQLEEIIERLSYSQAQLDLQQKKISREKENLLSQVRQFKDDSVGIVSRLNASISEYNEKIYILNIKIERMKKAFQDEYERVGNAEKQVMDKFFDWLEEHGNSQ